jgi:hypothetical protein
VILEALRFIFGLLLIFVLPGTMLIKAMFPRKGELDEEYNRLYVLTLGMATSVCLTILVGFVLGSLPLQDDGKGWFRAGYISVSLAGLTVIFFLMGWWRGAYPWLGLVHPRMARFPVPVDAPRGTRRHDQLMAHIEELTHDHDLLKREVKDLLKRERTHGRKMAKHFREEREKAEKKMDRLREELDRAKEEQSKLIYEAKQREDEKRKRRDRRRERRDRDRESKDLKKEAHPLPEVAKDEDGGDATEGVDDEEGSGTEE